MTFILTNDDGIDASGLKALHQAVQQLGLPNMIVAPALPHSGCGHQVTTVRPIEIQQRSEREFAIAGTPADCVRVALSHLCPTASFVLSGVNSGGNLGTDVYISGTVAAAREAAFHRLPSLAISHVIHQRRAIDWETATRLTVTVLDKLLHQPLEPGQFWNVNLPHLHSGEPDPELLFCALCTQPLPLQYEVNGTQLRYSGEYNKRSRDPGADVDVCFSGQIAITQLRL